MSELGEFETDLPASPRQMAGSLQREFGDDAQREGDSVSSGREVPERDPALRRSQQSLCEIDPISRIVAAPGNAVGEFLVKDPRPAAVAGHPQTVGGFLAHRAGKRVRAAPLALRRRDQISNPGGRCAEISRYEFILSRPGGGLDLAPAEPGGSSPVRGVTSGRSWRERLRRGPALRPLSERPGGIGIEPGGRHRVTWLREISAQHVTHDCGARRPPVRLLDGLITLRLTFNAGVAFGVGTSYTVFITLLVCGVIVYIIRTASRLRSLAWTIAIGLLLGGATGNFSDRLFRSPGPLRGRVVDWINLPHCPWTFNIADSSITCATVLMAILAVRGLRTDGTVAPRPSGPPVPEHSDLPC